FSTRKTCGLCHDYEKIAGGWHFNAGVMNVPAGRVGQPWMLVDAGTGTQIPLSYRHWLGTFTPEQLGLTSLQFVQLFGRHMPGGGVGELESDNPDEAMRQLVSGKLEINCMSCHSADAAHDQAEYAAQIARQNFRWAAAATCGFASASGSAKRMPDTYDPLMPDVLDDPKLVPPAVVYRKNAFDHKRQVFFDIVRKVPEGRCYFCHSNTQVGAERWSTDEDVHLAAGLTCVDCHRNRLEHNITRGYEGEDMASGNPLAAASTCEGCHSNGRLGAPVPRHAGIPPVHLDKLTCTACHSGLWPEQKTHRVKTSRAHGLGTHNINRSAEALPHILSPVFAKQPNGKIAPHNLIWPAFWGSMKGQKVEPIALEIVRQGAEMIIGKALPRSGDWPSLSRERITEDLVFASNSGAIEAQAVYVCGGKAYRLDGSGQLVAQDHPAAKPYLWPIAHDVRPAAQSLGSGGCGDCHATDSAFFFGDVEIDSPVASEQGVTKKMVEFQGFDPVYTKAFAFSFVFRPWLKVVSLASCAVIAGILLLYALRALGCITKALAGRDW
ncbi:MAG: cytochrome c3 family protein, partial [Planctomycetota bacterium]